MVHSNEQKGETSGAAYHNVKDPGPAYRVIIPVEIMDIIFREAPRLTKREILIWLAIWRNTFGENRIKALMSVRRLAAILKIPYPKIHVALKRLIQKGLVIQEMTGRGAILSINLEHALFKDMDRFKDPPVAVFESTEYDNDSQAVEAGCSPKMERDSVRREWGKFFGCHLPHGLEEKASAILLEIDRGNIDPGAIKFPINYLKAFIPREKSALKSSTRIQEGMKIEFQGEILTVGPSCCIFQENGVIPEGHIRKLLERGEMKIIEP